MNAPSIAFESTSATDRDSDLFQFRVGTREAVRRAMPDAYANPGVVLTE